MGKKPNILSYVYFKLAKHETTQNNNKKKIYRIYLHASDEKKKNYEIQIHQFSYKR